MFGRTPSLEVVAVAGLQWISWCVFSVVDFVFIFFDVVFSSNTEKNLIQCLVDDLRVF